MVICQPAMLVFREAIPKPEWLGDFEEDSLSIHHHLAVTVPGGLVATYQGVHGSDRHDHQ